MHDKVLDHYYLELKDGSIAVVVGNEHTIHSIIGYIKYRVTDKRTLWTRNKVYYERLVKTYNPDIVREHTAWRIFVPHYDTLVPCIPVSVIHRVYNPLDRSIELLHRVNDELEKITAYAISDILDNTSVLAGVTGSLLPRIHNPVYSDLDLVIYGYRESISVIEYIDSNKDLFRPLDGERFRQWCSNASLNTGLNPREASRFYRNWRRGNYNGREFSVIYNRGSQRDLFALPSFITIGRGSFKLELEGGIYALDYPSISRITKYKIVESSLLPPYDLVEVVSFEALFIPGLFEGGSFEASGIVQCSDALGYCRLLLGIHEYRGFLKYTS